MRKPRIIDREVLDVDQISSITELGSQVRFFAPYGRGTFINIIGNRTQSVVFNKYMNYDYKINSLNILETQDIPLSLYLDNEFEMVPY